MKFKPVLIAATLALTGVATPAFAWDVVGVREVSDHAERDTIVLEGDRHFTRIKLCVFRNPVEIHDLDVHFRNGGHQDVDVRERIAPGSCTRAIDLEGGHRDIASIVMKYEETSRRRRQATVRVLAE